VRLGYTNVNHFAWGYQGWLSEVDPEQAEAILPEAPVEGESFPECRLTLLQPANDCAYLQLAPKTKAVRLADIPTEYLLIMIYNEMCSLCMAELPNLDSMIKLIEQDGALSKRLKILGLGAGSTKRAVARMRKEKAFQILLLADEKWQLFEQLGRPLVPVFYLLKKDPAAGLLIHWRHTGSVGDPASFLRMLQNLMGPKS
jgi:peroxiredoxin